MSMSIKQEKLNAALNSRFTGNGLAVQINNASYSKSKLSQLIAEGEKHKIKNCDPIEREPIDVTLRTPNPEAVGIVTSEDINLIEIVLADEKTKNPKLEDKDILLVYDFDRTLTLVSREATTNDDIDIHKNLRGKAKHHLFLNSSQSIEKIIITAASDTPIGLQGVKNEVSELNIQAAFEGDNNDESFNKSPVRMARTGNIYGSKSKADCLDYILTQKIGAGEKRKKLIIFADDSAKNILGMQIHFQNVPPYPVKFINFYAKPPKEVICGNSGQVKSSDDASIEDLQAIKEYEMPL